MLDRKDNILQIFGRFYFNLSETECSFVFEGDDKPCDGTNTDPRIKEAFKKAKAEGLHCIAHAGENGIAASVTEAVNEMFAERIGHGYHVLDDPAVYQEMRNRNIHFEVCSHIRGTCEFCSDN